MILAGGTLWRMMNRTRKCTCGINLQFAVLLFCIAAMGCHSSERKPKATLAKDDLSTYRMTNDQPGHEFVKTEDFLVPVGSVVVIEGLEFESGNSTLNVRDRLIIQQIFNSIEEITENTPGDTNSIRVAELKRIRFEIRGYADEFRDPNANATLAEARAKAVLNLLTYLGTPGWRLQASAFVASRSISKLSAENRKNKGRIEFIRTR